MRTIYLKITSALCFFIALTVALPLVRAHAQDSGVYLHDDTGTFNRDESRYIASAGAELYKRTGEVRVVAALRQSIGVSLQEDARILVDDLGYDPEYTVVIFAAMSEKRVGIVAGDALSSELSDAVLSAIISERLMKNFDKKDYSGGMINAYDGVAELICIMYGFDYAGFKRTVNPLGFLNLGASASKSLISAVMVLVMAAFVVLTFINMRKRRGKRTFMFVKPRTQSHIWPSQVAEHKLPPRNGFRERRDKISRKGYDRSGRR